MPDLRLTLACWDYDRTRPLMDGRVKPEGIDLERIEASFKKGVLTVTMPKTPEAQKSERKIAIKGG